MEVGNSVEITKVDALDTAMSLHVGDKGVVLAETSHTCYIARDADEKDAWWLDKSKVHIQPINTGFGYEVVLRTIIDSLLFRCTAQPPVLDVKVPLSTDSLDTFYDYCTTLPGELNITAGVVLSDNGLTPMQVMTTIHHAIPATQLSATLFIFDRKDKMPTVAADLANSAYIERQHYTLERGKVTMTEISYKEN